MSDLTPNLDLTPVERSDLVRTKITCPFVGSVVTQGDLAIHGAAANPLGRIDDIEHLGNEGGGDLGQLLKFFAVGNHALMRDASGRLGAQVPDGFFSLDFPESRGSHPGDSGILQSRARPRTGIDFSEEAFARLTERAEGGRLTRTAVGGFIAENVHRDPEAKVLGPAVLVRMGHDLFELFEAVIPAALAKVVGFIGEADAAHPEATASLSKLLAEDNLAASSGEFGLLFTLLSSRQRSDATNAEPFVLVDELRAMFRDRRLSEGWKAVKKTRIEWARHTFALLVTAYEEHARLKRSTAK